MRNSDIKQLIEATESRLMDFKNQYPKNMADCWRRYTPYLILIVSVLLIPAFFFVSTLGFRALVLFGCPVAIIMSIKAIKRNRNDFVNLPDLKTPVLDSIRDFDSYMEYSDVRNYSQRSADEVSAVAEQKKRFQSITKVLCAIIVLSVLVFVVFVAKSGRTAFSTNPVFGYLDIENNSTFQANTVKGAPGNLATSACTFRIEDQTPDDGTDPVFYLRALDLSMEGADGGMYMLRFVNQDLVSEAHMPYFVFSAGQLTSGDGILSQGVVSGAQNSSHHRITNMRVLEKIKAGNLLYVVEKI